MNVIAPKKLNAREQLMVKRDCPVLAAAIKSYGIEATAADAIAYNSAVVYYALGKEDRPPALADLLDIYSLEEIAEICKAAQQVQEGEMECGFTKGINADEN